MKRPVLLLLAVCVSLSNAVPMSTAQLIPASVYAVLPFHAENDQLSPFQLDLLTRRYTEQLSRQAPDSVLPFEKTRRGLRARNRQPYSTASLADAIAAGRALDATHVIIGRITRDRAGYTLTTTLVDIEQGKSLRAARSVGRGPFDRFAAGAAASNLRTLLDFDMPDDPGPRREPERIVRPPTSRGSADASSRIPGRPASFADGTGSDDEPDIRPLRSWTFPWIPHRKQDDTPPATGWSRPVRLDFIEDHLELGARFMSFDLDQKDGAFLGTINRLEADRQRVPFLFVDWLFGPYVGVELTWNRVEATTLTFSHDASDGNIIMKGPALLLYARYPWEVEVGNRIVRVATYAGLGRVMLDADFDAEGWWAYGFPDPERYDQWRSAGSPPNPNNGYRRHIDLTDETGRIFALGCSIAVWNRLSVDLSYRTTDVNTDATYDRWYPDGNRETITGRFPMSYTSIHLGVRYSF